MKFKLSLILFFVSLQFSGSVFADCSTPTTGTEYVITATTTTCEPAVSATSIQVTGNVITSANYGFRFINATQLNLFTNSAAISGVNSALEFINGVGAKITLLNNGSSSLTSSIIGGDGISVYSNAGIALYSPNEITTINNYGTIAANLFAISNNSGTIGTLNNFNTIQSQFYSGIRNNQTIGSINNSSSALIAGGSFSGSGILNGGSIDSINNSSGASIVGNGGGSGINNDGGTILGIVNAGTISGSNGILNATGSTIGNANTVGINNLVGGVIQGATGNHGIFNYGTITSIVNNGTISGDAAAGYSGIYNEATGTGFGTIGSITNWGNIIGGINDGNGITGAARIGTLNNYQTGLVYIGTLPDKYNIIIDNSGFGTLAGSGINGRMLFGVSTLSTLRAGTFQNVLTGISAGNLSNTGASSLSVTGTVSTYGWTLAYDGSAWDLTLVSLVPPGPSTADTQQSLVNTASILKNTYALQNSVLVNSLTYDCQVFDKNNICISAGGRYAAVSAANGLNNTSALLIAGYRPHPNYRVGAYLDQNLSVSNMGSTVRLDNGAPLFGLFGAWNERLDGTGTEVKVSAAIGQKNTTVTRAVVGTSEAGTGSANLNSQGVQVLAKYGFAVSPEVIISPYAGIRYSQNNIGGYIEATSSTVTAPLTYNALNTNATTLLAGAGSTFKPTPVSAVFASAGIESDVATKNDNYSATGVTGLTSVNFNPNPPKNRPTATVGGYYDIAKNQRVSVSGIYRQESYQKVATTTALATYTVGF